MPQYYKIFLKEKNLFYLEVLIIFPYLCFEILKGGGGLVVNLVLF